MKMRKLLPFYQALVSEQRTWIETCGGTLTGYIDRYGTPGEARCRGDGGEAIYRADTAALARYEEKVRCLGGE